MDDLNFKSTEEIKVSQKIIDQVIGQEEAVEVIKKAAEQKRHVLLIGEPGTGKSLLGLALAELLPKEKLIDILALHNHNDENEPLIRTVPAGKGRELTTKAKMSSMEMMKFQNWIMLFLAILAMLVPWWVREHYKSDILFAAFFLGGMIFLVSVAIFMNVGKRFNMNQKLDAPRVIVDNCGKKQAPFLDATGAHAGALLGDVMHDPLQCILGEEKVLLPNGKPVEIKELVDPYFTETANSQEEKEASFEVLTGDDFYKCFTPTKVTRVFRRKINQDIIKIKTRKGYILKMTQNHPVAIFSKTGKIEYAPAGMLSKGDFTVVPYKIPGNATKKLPQNLLMILADALADGYFAHRTIAFKLRTEFKKFHFEKDIKESGFIPNTKVRGINIHINLNSADFLKKLRKLGVQKNGKKQIPNILFDLSQEQIKLFLARYISLDGYVNHQGQFELISKELIPDITALLLKIGIKAKIVPRIDTGFGKVTRKIQPRIRFNDYEFAKFYYEHTINPIHKKNLHIYLKTTKSTHVRYDDVVPLDFSILEQIRARTGLSKNKIHESYYAISSQVTTNKNLTRQFLNSILNIFSSHTNCTSLSELKQISEGSYAYDEVAEITKEKYCGNVYNLTTEKGTYLANFILTHNSGGLGTPAYERVMAGMMHKANNGVLFIDEIATLNPVMQQELLTALQEGKYPITGQSERSSGAMVRTEPVPCSFILVAAGNMENIKHMHPALRSRIRGYGYEVYMKETIQDTPENRLKYVTFVAQEIQKDKKIPHFSKEAVLEIFEEARRMANRKAHLSLRFRELGGLIRAAGDIAHEENAKLATKEHVLKAKKIAKTLEQQIADKFIERKKEYDIIITKGNYVGRVNGLAVLGSGGNYSGIILPIESEVTPGGKEKEIVATGKLGTIAKEAVKNVSAIIKKYFGEDIKEYDIYVQFLQTYEGVEGDSASIAVATSIISALKKIPVKQDVAMTGSLSVRGEVLPVGGVSAKVEAAIETGIKHVIIPKTNLKDIIISKEKLNKIKLIPADTIAQVLKEALVWEGKEKFLKHMLKEEQIAGRNN